MQKVNEDPKPLTQLMLFGYTSDSSPKKPKRRKYQTFIIAPHFEGLMKKYPDPRRKNPSEDSYKQLELSFER